MIKEAALTVKDLPVNGTKKLTADVRKRLMDIMEKEFQNQRAIYQEQEQKKRKEIIEKHKESTDWNKKKKEIEKISAKINQLKILLDEKSKEIKYSTGICVDGNYGYRITNEQGEKKRQELLDKINSAIDSTQASRVKQKLSTRLLLADTVGEALVIMHTVMGNDLIPTFTDVKQITG